MSEDPKIIDGIAAETENEAVEQETSSIPGANDKSIVITSELLPETLLLVPLYSRPLFPKMMEPVLVDNPELQKLIIEELQSSSLKYIGVVLVRSDEDEPFPSTPETTEAFYPVGVAAKILQISPPQPGAPFHIIVQALDRFEIVEMLQVEPPTFRAKVDYWHEPEYETNEELKAYSIAIIDSIRELIQLNPLIKEGLTLLLDRINVNDPGILADLGASITTASGAELQKLLATKSIRARIEQALILLKKEIEVSKIKVEINQRIEERISKQQREFFLREQLKEIKKELGISKDDTESELEKFQQRLSKLTLPEETQERIDEELEKLKLLEPSSAEFNVTRAYLDWLTILPWGIYTKDNYDIKKATDVLDADHYGLQDVKRSYSGVDLSWHY